MPQRFTIIVALYFVTCNFIACEVPISCNQENVQRCWSYIQDSVILQYVIPCLNSSQLTSFCKNFDYFDNCFSPVRENCFNYIQFRILAIYEGHRKAFSYLCRETTDEYLKHQSCFKDNNLQMNAAICNYSMTEYIKRVPNDSDVATATDKICQAGDLFLGCIDNNLKVLCGEAAATWMMDYNKKMLSPFFSSIPCKGWTNGASQTPSTDSSATITLAVCLSLICLIIIILIFILICHLKPQLFKSLPLINRISASKIFSTQESSHPPPYINDSQHSSQDRDAEPQPATCDQNSFSSGYFSTAERTPEGSAQYFREPSTSKKNTRIGSMEVISFQTSGISKTTNRTTRSRSAECTPELPRFLQHSMSMGPLQSNTVTPPLFEPPVANPFTSSALSIQKDDPVITDYYC